MRNTTKTFVASVGMGICAISYAIGANSATGSTFSAGGLNTTSTNSTSASSSNSGSANNSASSSTAASNSSSSTGASSTAKASSSSSAKTTAAAKKTTKKKKTTTTSGSTAKSTSSATPKPSSSASSSASSGGGTSAKVTKTGSLYNENHWGGQVQVTVTKTNGKVTAVDFAVATATGGRQQAFSYLAQLAVASNGSAVANVGGATFTTNVFNQALASAMSKF